MATDINRTTTITLPGEVSSEILQKTQESSAVMALARSIKLPGLGTTIPIITGDPDYSDNWHDIAGYATLVEQEIARLQQLEAQGAKLAEKIKQHKENQNV